MENMRVGAGRGTSPRLSVMETYRDVMVWVACLLLWSPTVYIIIRFMFFQHIPWTGLERLLWFVSCLLVILAGERLHLDQY